MLFEGPNHEHLTLTERTDLLRIQFDAQLHFPLLFVWVQGNDCVLTSDGVSKSIAHNSIVCLTHFKEVELEGHELLRFIRFNKEFYCVLDHDQEVSCKGLLFFSGEGLPVFQIPAGETEKFELLWRMFKIEMESKDELQLDMLQMMLKRFIILSTRLFKEQSPRERLAAPDVNLVREFQFLVETHFKTKHTVQAYADLLHKSPKTLANSFARWSGKTPLQLIHERKLLEAKRLLRYTDKQISEVGYELGFEDIQAFSRFFKKATGHSPSDFKAQVLAS